MKHLSILFRRIDNNIYMQAIRRGLVMSMPIFALGSLAVVLKFFPIAIYQELITGFASGILVDFLTVLTQGTFGIMSIYIALGVGVSYASLNQYDITYRYSCAAVALSSYAIFSGMFSDNFEVSSFGATGMFTAIFCAIIASKLFCSIASSDYFSLKFHTLGSDADFNRALSSVVPVGITIGISYVFNAIITNLFDVSGFQELFLITVKSIFSHIENVTLASFIFIVVMNLLWFFGVHGSNVLDGVAKDIFVNNMNINNAAIAAGEAPVHIFTKTFFDVFVYMGGCGSTICLIIAILLFSKHKNHQRIAKIAALPMIFNINELILFGIPLVLNVYFFVPFIMTPLITMTISYFAIKFGIVPMPLNSVEWITPVGIGGYVATGSIAGSLLQFFNIAVGVFIYRYFLLKYEHDNEIRMLENLSSLVSIVHDSENSGNALLIMEITGNEGDVAKMLAADLRYVLKNPDSLKLYYQPQYNSNDKCIGVEALIRWDHPRCGMIYPPILFAIAWETGLLNELERYIFELASHDINIMKDNNICPEKVSVNITASTLQDRHFADFLEILIAHNSNLPGVLNIELTEQMSFLIGANVEALLERIEKMGVIFAIDDFAMGHTSLKYLQGAHFELVKLDGSLVTDMASNYRSEEIIASIIQMSRSLNFKVMAECVESVAQRDKLMQLGCHLYQGYLYSRPLTLNNLILTLQNERDSQ